MAHLGLLRVSLRVSLEVLFRFFLWVLFRVFRISFSVPFACNLNAMYYMRCHMQTTILKPSQKLKATSQKPIRVSFKVSLVVHLGLLRVSLRVSLEVSFRLFLWVLFRVF